MLFKRYLEITSTSFMNRTLTMREILIFILFYTCKHYNEKNFTVDDAIGSMIGITNQMAFEQKIIFRKLRR